MEFPFFMVFGPFLFLGLSIGIGYLTGFFYRCQKPGGLGDRGSSRQESLKGTDELRMKLQLKSYQGWETAAYLVDEKDGQLEATYVATKPRNELRKPLVAAKLSQVQQGINMAVLI